MRRTPAGGVIPREPCPRNNDINEARAVTAWSGHAPEILWEYEGLVLSQDVRDGEAFPLLAAIPGRRSPHPSPGAARSTLMPYERRLDPAWAAKAVRLEPHHARLTLWNENPGRAPLLLLLRRRCT